MSSPLPLVCPNCRQFIQPDDRFCRQCSYPLRQSCRACGQEAPIWARFCPNCAQPFAQSATQQEERQTLVGFGLPEGAGVPPVPSALAGPQSGTLTTPTAPAGPQTGAPTVSNAPAAPQSGAPSVPSAPGGPQSGAPAVPSAPAASQSGVLAQAAGRAVTRSLASRLLGTAAGKVVAAVIAVTVVAAGSGAAAVAVGHNPIATAFQQITGQQSTSSSPATSEVTYIGSDGNIWDVTLPQGKPRQLTTDAKPGDFFSEADVVIYEGLAWSPDGSRLAVLRVSGTSQQITDEVLIFSPRGTITARATLPQAPSGRPFIWTPDGSMLAYRLITEQVTPDGKRGVHLVFVSPQTGNTERVVSYYEEESACDALPSPLGLDIDQVYYSAFGIDTFAWSPDGGSVLVPPDCANGTSMRVDLSSGQQIGTYPAGASYQPGGNLILGNWFDQSSGSIVIGLADANGNQVRTLVAESGNQTLSYAIWLGKAVWSTTGQMVYYEHNDSIWRIGVDGSNPQVLVAGTAPDSQGVATVMLAPCLSPDGHLLLYLQLQGQAEFDASGTAIPATGQWYIAQPDGTAPAMLGQGAIGTAAFGSVDAVWRPGT